MASIRVYELAKELGLSNKDLLSLCEKLSIEGKTSHSNTLSEDESNRIRRSVIRQAVSDRRGGGSNEQQIEGGARTELRVGDLIRRRKRDVDPSEIEEPTRKIDLTDVPQRSVNLSDLTPDFETEKMTRRRALAEADALFTKREVEPKSETASEGSSGDADTEAPQSRKTEQASLPSESSSGRHHTAGFERGSAVEAISSVSEESIQEEGVEEDEDGRPKEGAYLEEVRRRHDIRAPKVLGKIDLPARPAPGRRLAEREGSAQATEPGVASDGDGTPVSREGKSGRPARRRLELVVDSGEVVDDGEPRARRRRKQVLRKDDLVDYEGTREHWKQRKDKRGKRGRDLQAFGTDATLLTTPKASKRVVKVDNEMSVGELAREMGVKVSEVMTHLMNLGIMATINQLLDFETIGVIVGEFGFTAVNTGHVESDFIAGLTQEDNPDDVVLRPPVVTVMGHVDHGKTSLLDAIRKTSVTAEEAGGITQHIGAYNVPVSTGGSVTFLDTPGHEAFTALRSRGVTVTDIVVLVVAGDDGVMPQTIEAINHARAASVPIIVAVNKMDKPGANVERVINQLSQYGLVPEQWGGDTIVVPVSAVTRLGIDELLGNLHAQAEVLELKANPKRPAMGSVIESRLDRGRGPVITVLVQNGTLRKGDVFVAGPVTGKVRALLNHEGKFVDDAGPGMPVEVLGTSTTPQAGNDFIVLESEAEARRIAEHRAQRQRTKELLQMQQGERLTLESFSQMVGTSTVKDLAVVVKADVQGSLEAVSAALKNLTTEEVRVKVIHEAVGAITENDVQLAIASRAVVIAFNVRPSARAATLIESEHVQIVYSRIIYELVDAVKSAMHGMLEPTYQEKTLGRVEVRETFRVPKVGMIAGSYVLDGSIQRGAMVRLLRDNVVIFEGRLSSLKRFKDDVKEVQSGYECGIGLEGYNDLKTGDIMEVYKVEEVARAPLA